MNKESLNCLLGIWTLDSWVNPNAQFSCADFYDTASTSFT